jgi:hypothetical protein
MRLKSLKALLSGHSQSQEARISMFASRLRRLLDREFERAVKEVAGMEPTAAAAALGRIDSRLRDMQLAGTIRRFLEDVYARELRQVKAYYELVGKGVDLDPADIEAARALIEIDLSQISTSISKIATTLKSQIMRQVILGEQPNVRDLAEGLSSRMEANIQTELRTATMAFNQTVNTTKAREVFGESARYLYMGPDDAKTRPFCHETLNPSDRDMPIYSEDEIAAMTESDANEQGLDVMIYHGGYNCRHRWNAVSADFEKYADDY